MSKFVVTVSYTKRFEKQMTIYARDEDEATDKAENIVSGWEGVEDVETTDVSED
jgi:translation elongation factor EF-1beta